MLLQRNLDTVYSLWEPIDAILGDYVDTPPNSLQNCRPPLVRTPLPVQLPMVNAPILLRSRLLAIPPVNLARREGPRGLTRERPHHRDLIVALPHLLQESPPSLDYVW